MAKDDFITIHCWDCIHEFEVDKIKLCLLMGLTRPDMVLCPACEEKKLGPINEHAPQLDRIVKHLTWLELLSIKMDKEMLIDLGTEMCIFMKTKYPDPRARALHLALRLTFKDGRRGLTNKYLFTRKLFIDKVL